MELSLTGTDVRAPPTMACANWVFSICCGCGFDGPVSDWIRLSGVRRGKVYPSVYVLGASSVYGVNDLSFPC